ncbi:MAG: hypothetical protein DRI39_06690 [Chloroflexi bacterium]|nr:MAG: hypothetical protein DRI39_06690 [Chloroflexota bacterium]
MNAKPGKSYGKYVPISSGGQVKLYLPLESCTDADELRTGGYDVSGEARDLMKLVALIKQAEAARAESEQRKRLFVLESLRDFSQAAGSIKVVCPYCLGRINQNCPSQEGEVLCGWHDQIGARCDGNALYTIDRANLVLGIPDVEKYTCLAKGSQLDLAIYDLDYLKEEIARRSMAIRGLGAHGEVPISDKELAMIFPLRISIQRTRQTFKESVFDLLKKDAIEWLNTLSLEELATLLERSASQSQFSGKWQG